MVYQVSKRWTLPIAVLFALVLSVVSVSQSHGQDTSSGDTAGVPKVKAGDHQGLAIGADTESYVRDLPSDALVDRNLASGSGYTGYQIDDMARMAKEENVVIGARATNVDSMRHIRDRKAVPKPLTIKSNTITEFDTYLGARPEDKGLVGYFNPNKPDKAKVPEHLWNDVEKRYAKRLEDYNNKELRGSIDKLVKQGKVVEKDGKLYAALRNADGSTQIKPFAGDIDAVYFKDATTGKFIPPGKRYDRLKRRWMGLPDKPESTSFLERFKRSWSGDKGSPDYWTSSGAPGQHGAETNLVSDITEGLKEGTPEYMKALKKAEDLQASLAENHWKKGEVVMEMRPDGHLRRGTRFTKDTPLPNLHKAGNAADDLSDAAKAASKSLDATKASKALGKALETLDTLGNVVDRAEIVMALGKLKDIYDTIAKARDPLTSDEEAAALFGQAEKMRNDVAGDLSISVLLETFPLRFPSWHLPAAYLVWTLKCGFRDWGRQNGSCTEDHYNAAIRAWDELIGDKLERDAQRAVEAKAQCAAFHRAVREGRAKPKWPFNVKDVCDAIKQGWTTTDMRDDDGQHMSKRCAGLEGRVGTATALVKKGKLSDAQSVLNRARSHMDQLGAQACSGLDERIAAQLTRISDEVAPRKAEAETGLAVCRFSESLTIIGSLPSVEREALMARWNKALTNEAKANALITQAKALEDRGKSKLAAEKLQQARELKPCKNTIAEIDKAIGRHAQTKTASGEKKEASECDPGKLIAPTPPSQPTATYIVCGPPAGIYSSCTTVHCMTNQQLSAYLNTRENFKIKKKVVDCPTPNKEARTAAACPDPVKNVENDEPQPNKCALAESQYQTARASYAAGDAGAYKTGLIKAEQAMSTLPANACDGLTAKIARGHEQAEILNKINASAGELLSSCKGANPRARAAQMLELSGLLSKTSQPHVQQLRRRLDAAHRLASAYADTKDAFRVADLERAGGHLGNARDALGAVDAGDCPDLRTAVAKAPRVFANWRNGVRKISDITQSCNIDEMERYRSRLQGMSSPIAETLVARLNIAVPECRQREREKEVAGQREQEELREASCEEGFYLGAKAAGGNIYCVPTQATADAWCEANNQGTGYQAANIKSDGSYGCLPTRAHANAWCRTSYPTAGLHFAGTINSDGTFDCVANQKSASAACRAANPGMRGVYARMKANGLYDCEQTRKATTARRPQPRQQPGLSAQDIARGTAIIGGIINQIQRGSGGGGRSRGGGDCRQQVGDMFSNAC